MSDFRFLCVHTLYSLDGGPSSPEDYVRRAAELGYGTVGLMDRGPLAGVPAFSAAAEQYGIAPLFGMEIDLQAGAEGRDTQPIVLFARDGSGLGNLACLAGEAYADWPRQSKAIGLEEIREHAGGLVAVLPGEVSLEGVTEAWVGELRALFPDLYVGLPTGGARDGASQERVAATSSRLGLPLLALPVARYLRVEDATAYEALAAARLENGWAVHAGAGASGDEYLRAPDEVAGLFAGYPEAVENAAKVVALCSAGLKSFTLSMAEAKTELRELKRIADGWLDGAKELPEGSREQLDAEMVRIQESGKAPAWEALAAITILAREKGLALGAPGGGVDGTLAGAALGLYPGSAIVSGSTGAGEAATLRSLGVEVPWVQREEIFDAFVERYGEGGIAQAVCGQEITPIAALQAAVKVSSKESTPLSALTESVRERGWQALEEAGAAGGAAGEMAGVALMLRGVPVAFKPDADNLLVMSTEQEQGTLPLLGRGGGGRGWIPWSCETLERLGLPTLALRPSWALSVLTEAERLAGGDLTGTTELPEKAIGLLKKGSVAGIPYISAEVAKGWKGDFSLESLAAIVARSTGPKDRPKAPEGVSAWAEWTADTGGTLLYYDQFENIARQAAGISREGAAALRLAMLKPETDLDGALRARFTSGCAASGLEEEAADALWKALAAATSGLTSRSGAFAHAQAAARLLAIKVAQPAAFIAAHINMAWRRGGAERVAAYAEEARHLDVALLAPSVHVSEADPVPEKQSNGSTAVRWGLAQLPGWGYDTARRFVEARVRVGGCDTTGRFARVAVSAELSDGQIESLVRSGACDGLGGRGALVETLPGALEWARTTGGQEDTSAPLLKLVAESMQSPRTRLERRAWEEKHLGAGFTDASEMDRLRKALDNSGGLRDRLITARQVGTAHVGQSVCLVGLLHDVRLIEEPAGAGRKRNGKDDAPRIAVATVQDAVGEIELVAFPPNYKRHAEIWTENNLAIITARVCLYPGEEEVYLLCEHLALFDAAIVEEELEVTVKAKRAAATVPLPKPEVQSADGGSRAPAAVPSAPAPTQAGASPAARSSNAGVATSAEPPDYHLIITLPASHDDREDIDRMINLDRLLKAHPGRDTVTLRIPYSPETGAVTSAQLPRGVRYNSRLEEGIRSLLGPDALALIKLIG